MAEESCVPWFPHARGVVHTWQQAGRQHDSCGKTLSFSEIKTQPSCEILMTRKTFHTKSATPLTVLTFEWQEGYPTLRPWSPPPLQLWEQIMSNMGEVGCQRCKCPKAAPVQSKFLDEEDKKPEGEESSWANFFRDKSEISEVIPESERFQRRFHSSSSEITGCCGNKNAGCVLGHVATGMRKIIHDPVHWVWVIKPCLWSLIL